MGRTANTARRSPYSAIILYGRSRASINSTPKEITTATISPNHVSDPPSDDPSNDKSPSNLKVDLKESFAKRNITNRTYFKRAYYGRGTVTAQAVASLAADVLEVFEQVPYVKIVAGLIQQIIKISDVRLYFCFD